MGLVLLGATLAAAPVFAQQDVPPPPPQGDSQGPPPSGPHGRGGMMNPERRLEMMTHELNLSPEQQTAIKQVWSDQRAKMQAQREQAQQMAPEDRRAAMMAAHQEEKTKIEAILTADQKTKYEAMEARMRERMEHRNGDNPPPPPPQ